MRIENRGTGNSVCRHVILPNPWAIIERKRDFVSLLN